MSITAIPVVVCETQVSAAVIQWVAVDMVHHDPPIRAVYTHHQAMHINAPLRPTRQTALVAAGIVGPRIPTPCSVPFPLHQIIVHIVIHNGVLLLGERD